jgi:hypothetical protein
MAEHYDLRPLIGQLFDRRRACLDALRAFQGIRSFVNRLVHVDAAQDGLSGKIKFINRIDSKSHLNYSY